MLVFLTIQSISNGVFFGKVVWGSVKEFITYGLIQTLLHFALVIIVMCIAVLIHNNVISMLIAVCLCMNITAIFYGFLDKILSKFGVEDFHVMEYTVSGRMTLLDMDVTAKAADKRYLPPIAFLAGT